MFGNDSFFSSSRSTSRNRSRRSPSPKGGRRPQNEVHRENPIPSSVLGVFGLSQHTGERDLKGNYSSISFNYFPFQFFLFI